MSIIPWQDPVLLKLMFMYKTKYSLQVDHVCGDTVGIASYPCRCFKMNGKTNSLNDPVHLTMSKTLRSYVVSGAKNKPKQNKNK